MLLPFLNVDMQCVIFSPEITGFPIVSGRWLGLRQNEKFYQNYPELEEEYHYVLICKKNNFVEIRRRYINSYLFVKPSMFKLTQLLTSENRSVTCPHMCNL